MSLEKAVERLEFAIKKMTAPEGKEKETEAEIKMAIVDLVVQTRMDEQHFLAEALRLVKKLSNL